MDARGDGAIPRRRRMLARASFAGIILIVPIQYYIAKRIGEPYPSLILPSFAGDNTHNGKFETRTADVYVSFCDGTERVVTPNELLNGMPGSHINSVMDWVFGPRMPRPHPIPSWKKVIFSFSPAYEKRVLRGEGESFVDSQTKLWIQKRLCTRYGSQPKALEINWFLDMYDLNGPTCTRSRRLLSIIPITLGECAH